ncbi:MAG TPA: hypothetical protein VKE22_26990 [Haliangiales bacterium]|nr:hypothetical protein [Haliangiales bacterium]
MTIVAGLIAVSGAAFAKGGTPPVQTHHCKMPDGTIDPKKTHRQCTAAKGTWAKDAPADAAKEEKKPAPPGTAKEAPSPAPAPAQKPPPSK